MKILFSFKKFESLRTRIKETIRSKSRYKAQRFRDKLYKAKKKKNAITIMKKKLEEQDTTIQNLQSTNTELKNTIANHQKISEAQIADFHKIMNTMMQYVQV